MPEETIAAEVELAQPPAIETADEPTNDNLPEPGLETPATGEEQEPAEEFDTIELDGKQYQVPKALKPNFMLHADYTQKTQATAAMAKELAAEKERLAEQFKASEEELGHRAELRSINAQIEKYRAYTEQDWAQLKQEDPQSWNEHQIYFSGLDRRLQQVQGAISEAETKRTQEAQSVATKRIEETQAHAMKIKGWSPAMDAEVIEYAKSKGFDPKQVAELMSPAVYDMIRYAKIGEQVALKRTTALPTPTAQPLHVVGAKKNPPSGFDPATADMDEYASNFKKREQAKWAEKGR